MHQSFALIVVLLTASIACGEESSNQWTRWRGNDGMGQAEHSLPVNWSAGDVVWRTKLPGEGQSSPVAWGDRIFLTAAKQQGRQRIVLCVDADSGEILWQRTAWEGEQVERIHKMNSWASATCATDGKHVAAFFGLGGLHCYDVEGNHLWSRDLGEFSGPWGTAASPIIVGDLVIQNCDADENATLLAVDKRTGKTVWQTPRLDTRGWSTPVLIESNGRTEMIINGHTGMTAYDPATGKELWFSKGDRGRGTPTVVSADELLVAVSGRPGDMWAVRAGGSGDVSSTHEAWRTNRRGGRDLPSPVVVGNVLFVVNMQGVAVCYDIRTGEETSKMRIGGNYSASPISAGGLVYLPSESGETVVIRPGPEMKVIARNPLGAGDEEVFRASLMPTDGGLYCRSSTALYFVSPQGAN